MTRLQGEKKLIKGNSPTCYGIEVCLSDCINVVSIMNLCLLVFDRNKGPGVRTMRRKIKISLDSLTEEQVLDKDIFAWDDQLLLKKGTILTRDLIESMRKRNIKELYIRAPIEPPVKPAVNPPRPPREYVSNESKIAGIYSNAIGFVEGFISDIKRDKEINVEAVQETVNTFSDNIVTDMDVLAQMRRLKDKDDYLLTHSVNVSLLAIMIGKWLGYDKDMVNNLGIAGILHDLGKVHIPEEILNKPSKLTDAEKEIMNNHPVIGFRLCRECANLDVSVKHAVLMHHERMDGSGYPAQISSGKITQAAAILAIADTYDAVTSARVYSPKRTPYMAAEIILQESLAGRVDSRIGKIFYDKLISLSVGNEVLLSNQKKGVIVFMNPLKPTYPTVKVDDKLYNLEKEKGLSIVTVL